MTYRVSWAGFVSTDPMFTHLSRILLAVSILVPWARAENEVTAPPWERQLITLESGMLWQAGTGTPLAYRFVQTQVSWRSRAALEHTFSDGSHLVVRHRFALIGSWVQQGPEHHYVGFSGSPSLELWNAEEDWALFGGAGGGFGLIDSQGVRGGQGQDFTLNWFARGGIEHITQNGVQWSLAVMFQHMSNGGATDPNPGIDAVGLMAGWSWRF